VDLYMRQTVYVPHDEKREKKKRKRRRLGACGPFPSITSPWTKGGKKKRGGKGEKRSRDCYGILSFSFSSKGRRKKGEQPLLLSPKKKRRRAKTASLLDSPPQKGKGGQMIPRASAVRSSFQCLLLRTRGRKKEGKKRGKGNSIPARGSRRGLPASLRLSSLLPEKKRKGGEGGEGKPCGRHKTGGQPWAVAGLARSITERKKGGGGGGGGGGGALGSTCSLRPAPSEREKGERGEGADRSEGRKPVFLAKSSLPREGVLVRQADVWGDYS